LSLPQLEAGNGAAEAALASVLEALQCPIRQSTIPYVGGLLDLLAHLAVVVDDVPAAVAHVHSAAHWTHADDLELALEELAIREVCVSARKVAVGPVWLLRRLHLVMPPPPPSFPLQSVLSARWSPVRSGWCAAVATSIIKRAAAPPTVPPEPSLPHIADQ
jgi:hypothetical protein